MWSPTLSSTSFAFSSLCSAPGLSGCMISIDGYPSVFIGSSKS